MELAKSFRPTDFSEMVGQQHLVGPNGILTNMLKNDRIRSCIFHGNPGTGKTTVAMILAKEFGLPFHSINSTNGSLDGKLSEKKTSFSDMLKSLVIEHQKQYTVPMLLYVDEIQYLNRKQQQLFLPYTENGDIVMIASTSENPYHEIDKALISRCTILEFKPVDTKEMALYLWRICDDEDRKIQQRSIDFIAENAGGDVRKAVGILESAFIQYPKYNSDGTKRTIMLEDVDGILPSIRMSHYDKNGIDHYAMKSGLQKSIRGSDPNAAVFYLCRLLEGGDLESACRRLMVIANEDIGLANPDAIPFTFACTEMAKQLGMPEAPKPLTNAVIYLALSRKSSTAESSYDAALADVRQGLGSTVPTHIRHPYDGYRYPHNYPNHWCPQEYLPDDVKDHVYYVPGDNSFEENHHKYHQMVVEDYRRHHTEYEALAKNIQHKGD